MAVILKVNRWKSYKVCFVETPLTPLVLHSIMQNCKELGQAVLEVKF